MPMCQQHQVCTFERNQVPGLAVAILLFVMVVSTKLLLQKKHTLHCSVYGILPRAYVLMLVLQIDQASMLGIHCCIQRNDIVDLRNLTPTSIMEEVRVKLVLGQRESNTSPHYS